MYNYCYHPKTTSMDFYTDLACERKRAAIDTAGVEYEKRNCLIGTWERVKISSEEGSKKIGRPCGLYDTLNVMQMDMLDEEDIFDAEEEVARRLCEICDDIAVMPARILVVGLGNSSLTPDSVGPKAATRVKPTKHIREYDEPFFDKLECSEIAVLCPGVTAHSGLDTSETVKTVCESIVPDVVIAIDSLMTDSRERLGSTLQISDTGIFPGGLGNLKNAITRTSIGVPVIGIGVPTVMDLRNFYDKDFYIGSTSPLFVSPREIDEITDTAAKIISGAINQAFGLDY